MSEDDFESIVAGLEDEIDDDPQGEYLDVTQLDTLTLLNYREMLTNKLMEMGELLNVKTQQGRDIQSMRSAAVVEINKRAGQA